MICLDFSAYYELILISILMASTASPCYIGHITEMLALRIVAVSIGKSADRQRHFSGLFILHLMPYDITTWRSLGIPTQTAKRWA